MDPTMETYGFISKLLGDWSQQPLHPASILFRILVAFVFASIIGSERARKRHPAGLRTFIIVALGAVFAAMCDRYMIAMAPPKASSMSYLFYRLPLISAASIISQAIISSNSILFSSKSQLKGLTTTVSLWATGIISLCIGFGLYDTAAIGFLAMSLCVGLFPALERWIKGHSSLFEIHVELQSRDKLQLFISTLREFGLKIEEIEYNPAYANSGLGVYTLQLIKGTKLKKQSHAEIIEALSALDYVQFIEEI
ncbi:MAG: MgtC/SapB family protein [Victivallales bacterium]|nr:MgtC/SapB family protein [Victivallales bacterium]